jgi:tmRNA-binding protein
MLGILVHVDHVHADMANQKLLLHIDQLASGMYQIVVPGMSGVPTKFIKENRRPRIRERLSRRRRDSPFFCPNMVDT